MIFKSIVLLLFINSFVLSDKYYLLECFYNRYMMYYFTMHNLNFQNIFKESNNITFDKLKEYSDELKTQGNIVIAMLEELKRKNRVIIYPSTLMSMNLYLNNVFETLMVRTFLKPHENYKQPMSHEYNNKNNIFKIQFEKFNTEINEDILNKCYRNDMCKQIHKIVSHISYNRNQGLDKKLMTRDDFETYTKELEDYNDLLPEKSDFIYNGKYDTLEFLEDVQQLEDSNVTIKHLLGAGRAANTNFKTSVFHPNKMLFNDLLSREKYTDGVLELTFEYDTDINLLRDVTINEQLADGQYANIMVLFEMIKRTLNVDYIESFQRQVLAASVYPVLACVGSYLSLVTQIFYSGQNKYGDVVTRAVAHGEEIDKSGKIILELLRSFIKLNLLPEKVLTHLTFTAEELEDLIDFKDKKLLQTRHPKWIVTIYRRCSRPMTLNYLLFPQIDAPSMNMNSAENVNDMITTLNTNIEKVNKYREALEKKYIKDFQNVVNGNPLFSYNRMFVDKMNFNIVKIYKDDYNKIMNETKIKSQNTPNFMND
ncbi:uncharacterized protein LOC126834389 [Adelges cooleyi]|uniref:uncharacterized protein LOC126834389 n=1 Tax=Adelges cooleyi TaxID=133065 RepID=UPI002180419E|nr:uncharacterized protein LOC126834389 [Adelges cooleyi]